MNHEHQYVIKYKVLKNSIQCRICGKTYLPKGTHAWTFFIVILDAILFLLLRIPSRTHEYIANPTLAYLAWTLFLYGVYFLPCIVFTAIQYQIIKRSSSVMRWIKLDNDRHSHH